MLCSIIYVKSREERFDGLTKTPSCDKETYCTQRVCTYDLSLKAGGTQLVRVWNGYGTGPGTHFMCMQVGVPGSDFAKLA